MLALFVKVSTTYRRNFSSTKDPQSFRGAAVFCGLQFRCPFRTSLLVTSKYSINSSTTSM